MYGGRRRAAAAERPEPAAGGAGAARLSRAVAVGVVIENVILTGAGLAASVLEYA